MSLIRVSEDDNWIVDYDTERVMYRTSYFEDGHFVDQYRFNAYDSFEKAMYEYSYAYVKGAAEFMKYIHDYYNEETHIYPSEMEGILKEFLQQYGELKEV